MSLLFVVASCSTKADMGSSSDFTRNANDSTKVYSDLTGTSLTIKNSVWFTTTTNSNSFGQINLAITGSTNVDKVTVMMHGDGVPSEENILMDASKGFKNDTVVISFTHFSGALPTSFIETSTVIKAYRGTDTLKITLNSGKLKY